jgi:hypothetical protein
VPRPYESSRIRPKRISGRRQKKIVSHRDAHGAFKSRKALLEVEQVRSPEDVPFEVNMNLIIEFYR